MRRTRPPLPLLPLLLLPLVSLLPGCAQVGAQLAAIRLSEGPSPVEVLAVGTRFPTDTSGHLDVRLNVDNNASDVAMTVTGVEWEAWVEGHHFASGAETFSIQVDPRGEQILYLTFPLAFEQVPLRQGPIRLQIGLRGRITARLGEDSDVRGFSFQPPAGGAVRKCAHLSGTWAVSGLTNGAEW